MNYNKIGKFIATLRKEQNLTQYELSIKLSISRENVSKWERGVNMPTVDSLAAMSEIFGVSINELILGERKNEANNKELDNISLEVLKESRKKLKKTVTYFVVLIFAMIFAFLSYYFVNTYNTIKVYKITGEGTEFSSLDGLVLISKKKSYIKLGKVISESNYEYKKVELYFLDKNNKKNIIYISDSIDDSLSSYYGYNEYFKYNEVEEVINNLYMRIIYEDKEETIKLEVKRDMINNNIVDSPEKDITDKDYEPNTTDVPQYIKNNFNFNKTDNTYSLNYKENDITYDILYIIDTNTLQIMEKAKDNNCRVIEFYVHSNEMVSYLTDVNQNITNKYITNLITNKCLEGECDKNAETTKYFKENYYKKYFGDDLD